MLPGGSSRVDLTSQVQRPATQLVAQIRPREPVRVVEYLTNLSGGVMTWWWSFSGSVQAAPDGVPVE